MELRPRAGARFLPNAVHDVDRDVLHRRRPAHHEAGIYAEKLAREGAAARAYPNRNPANRDLVREALRKAHREDLIGFGPKILVRPGDGKSSGSGGGKGGKGGKGVKGAHGAGIGGNGARGGNGGKGATSGRGSKAGATKRGDKGGLSNGRGEHVGTHRPNAGNGSKRPRR